MRYIFILSFVLLLCKPSFSQTVYIFNGNGSWKVAANWVNNLIPPSPLPTGDSIIINPSGTGECILDTFQAISNGGNMVIKPDKKFTISGTLRNTLADSSFTDTRDGQQYSFRHMGSQVWMTQNLNYAVDTSVCYNNDPSNCAVYGRLYSWTDALIATPPGWHVPSDLEWTVLTDFLGTGIIAGAAMKDTGTTHWLNPNAGANNSSGFTGLPGGYRFDNTFIGIGYYSYWWSSTSAQNDINSAWIRALQFDIPVVGRGYPPKTYGCSVRCVRD